MREGAWSGDPGRASLSSVSRSQLEVRVHSRIDQTVSKDAASSPTAVSHGFPAKAGDGQAPRRQARPDIKEGPESRGRSPSLRSIRATPAERTRARGANTIVRRDSARARAARLLCREAVA